MAMRSRSGSSAAGVPPRANRLVLGQPGRLEDRGIGQARVAGRTRDPAPVGVAAVGGRLDQARRDDRSGHGPGIGVVGRAGHLGRDERRGPLAVRGLLPREIARHGLDGGAEHGRLGRPGLGRRRRRRPRRQHEHRVVRPRVAVDRELVPGPRRGRPQQAPQDRSASTAASVSTTESIVAMFGWIIPTPFAMPLTVTVTGAPSASGSSTVVVATFVTESVVRSASAIAVSPSFVAASFGTSAVEPGPTLSNGSRVPMTPVERWSVSCVAAPVASARSRAISRWSSSPASPVAALARAAGRDDGLGPPEPAARVPGRGREMAP